MTADFSRRSVEREWMDAEDIDFDTFQGCLRDLAKVNVVTLAHRPTLRFLDLLRRAGHLDLGRPIRIVDVGSGYGDLLRAIARWAERARVPVTLIGVDLNPWSALAASAATGPDAPINWETRDVFAFAADCDLVVSSLFTHHLGDTELARFVGWMETHASLGWFINDLRRSRVSYAGFKVLAQLMGWHPFVRHDGPLSIARAFTANDWRRLLSSAGLPDRTVVRRWFPYRLCVARVKTVSGL